jgi:fermentation-respiration switch protein FrsA (DUF1100 family)
LVIHGDSDAIVPFEVSGRRTAEAIDGSKLVLVPDAPHGLNAPTLRHSMPKSWHFSAVNCHAPPFGRVPAGTTVTLREWE